jgi:hypothetical protein
MTTTVYTDIDNLPSEGGMASYAFELFHLTELEWEYAEPADKPLIQVNYQSRILIRNEIVIMSRNYMMNSSLWKDIHTFVRANNSTPHPPKPAGISLVFARLFLLANCIECMCNVSALIREFYPSVLSKRHDSDLLGPLSNELRLIKQKGDFLIEQCDQEWAYATIPPFTMSKVYNHVVSVFPTKCLDSYRTSALINMMQNTHHLPLSLLALIQHIKQQEPRLEQAKRIFQFIHRFHEM